MRGKRDERYNDIFTWPIIECRLWIVSAQNHRNGDTNSHLPSHHDYSTQPNSCLMIKMFECTMSDWLYK